MKALLCTRLGGPEDLAIADLPDPMPGPGEAVVRVTLAALNFFDTLIIAGRYQVKPDLPFSPGGEAVGMPAVGVAAHNARTGAGESEGIRAGPDPAGVPGVLFCGGCPAW